MIAPTRARERISRSSLVGHSHGTGVAPSASVSDRDRRSSRSALSRSAREDRDILPAVALIRDPAEPDIMRRPPQATGHAGQLAGLGPDAPPGRAAVGGRAQRVRVGRLAIRRGHARRHAGVPDARLLHPFQALNCCTENVAWWRLPPNRLIWISVVVLVAVQYVAIAPTRCPRARDRAAVGARLARGHGLRVVAGCDHAALESLARYAPPSGAGLLPAPRSRRYGMTTERLMNCICGHAQWEHVPGGRCRVPDCPCDHFEPGDTLASAGGQTITPPWR